MSVITSGRLLKAGSLPQRTVPVSFAYADIEARCDEQLQAAQEQARQLVIDAESQAEELRTAARQMGHATGSLQAEAEFDARVDAEVQLRVAERLNDLVPALQAATAQLIRDREQILLHWESAVVKLSLAVAERIVGREIASQPAAPQALIAEALQLTAGASSVVLRLNPADVQDIKTHAADWQQMLANQRSLKVVADSEISRGGCLLETPAGMIDGRIETQLARIAAELLGEGH